MIDIEIRCNKCLEPVYEPTPIYCLHCYEDLIKKYAREREKNREIGEKSKLSSI